MFDNATFVFWAIFAILSCWSIFVVHFGRTFLYVCILAIGASLVLVAILVELQVMLWIGLLMLVILLASEVSVAMS